MISVGQKMPSVTVKRITPEGPVDVKSDELVKGKHVVLLTMPGAFTTPCTKNHLPGYVARAAELKGKGVDDIICVTVNDHFVVRAWAEQTGAMGVITMVSDGNGELTRALGVEFDGTAAGFGPVRGKRGAIELTDGVVKTVDVEAKNADVTITGAEACLARL